jgi:hypothetical protein
VGTPVVSCQQEAEPLRLLDSVGWFVVWEVVPIQTNRCNPVLISRRQQFVVPAITYQRRIVQSGRDGNTLVVSCLHNCVVGVAGVPVGSRRRHLSIPTQEVASGGLPPNAVDPGLRVKANRAVRPDPVVRNDLVHTTSTRTSLS